MNSLDCLTNRAALGWISTATVHEQFWTVSPTEQLWDGFPRLRCMNSLDCLTNRVALEWISTATVHEQFWTVLPTEQLWGGFPRLRCMNSFGLAHQQSSSGMGFHGYAA